MTTCLGHAKRKEFHYFLTVSNMPCTKSHRKLMIGWECAVGPGAVSLVRNTDCERQNEVDPQATLEVNYWVSGFNATINHARMDTDGWVNECLMPGCLIPGLLMLGRCCTYLNSFFYLSAYGNVPHVALEKGYQRMTKSKTYQKQIGDSCMMVGPFRVEHRVR